MGTPSWLRRAAIHTNAPGKAIQKGIEYGQLKSNITESVRSNIIFINTFLCWICFVFLAKTGQCKRRHFGYSDISFIFHCNVWNYLALEYMLCDFVYIASKYVGRYWMFIWNCHWTYIKSGKFIFRKSGIVFFQLL